MKDKKGASEITSGSRRGRECRDMQIALELSVNLSKQTINSRPCMIQCRCDLNLNDFVHHSGHDCLFDSSHLVNSLSDRGRGDGAARQVGDSHRSEKQSGRGVRSEHCGVFGGERQLPRSGQLGHELQFKKVDDASIRIPGYRDPRSVS